MTSLSIIGVGAFGQLSQTHLKNHFDITLYDPSKGHDTPITDVCKSDIILLCTPVCVLKNTLKMMVPHVRAGQLVLDVCSVKVKPAQWMADILPDHVDIVATHPIFGPQSGKNGIEGLPISLMNIRGERLNDVETFCAQALHLKTIITTPEQHDQEMAYVQGLTHSIARILRNMNIPELQQTTQTYDYLLKMANLIKNDSEELFQAIQTDNPYVRDITQRFFDEATQLEKSLQQAKDA